MPTSLEYLRREVEIKYHKEDDDRIMTMDKVLELMRKYKHE